MSDETQQTPRHTEKLVAYLDGELPEGDSREVELSLVSDPEMRTAVEQLNRTYELLDLLPRPNASGEFSSRTLATLKVADVTASLPVDSTASAPTVSLSQLKPSRFSIAKRIAWVSGLLSLCVLGFVAGRIATRPPGGDAWLDDVTLIERIEVYREIGDVEFLRELKQEGVLDERRLPGPP